MNTPQAYSIPEFCESFRISRGTFYNLQKTGQAPRTMKIGTRVLISRDAADEWRRSREAASEKEAA